MPANGENSRDISAARTFAAVAFDAVGTVMYPTPSVADAYQAAIRRHCGMEISSEIVSGTVRQALQERSAGADLSTSEPAEHEFWADLIRQCCPESDGFQACFDELFRHFAAPSSWGCYPEVADVLNHLHRQGLRTAIASNFDTRLNAVCDGIPQLAAVQTRIISSVVGWRKPAPQFFAAVCDQLNLSPGKILFVGDDLLNDVQGALSAGMQAAWVCRTASETRLPIGALKISTLNDLLTVATGSQRTS